jgi:L-rhamnose mutarotase
MKRYCFALDLKDDPQLIAEYEARHKEVWPEVIASIKDAGIVRMEIYRIHNRLFMIMETTGQFDFERKAAADLQNDKVRQWEELMWKYQQPLPAAEPGEKWRLMEKIFELQ